MQRGNKNGFKKMNVTGELIQNSCHKYIGAYAAGVLYTSLGGIN